MQNYVLFIDTETTGLPKNYNLPYSNNDNWPYAVQVSWVVCTKIGEEVKREDHFIGDNDFVIRKKAFEIHGISRGFLNQHGEPRSLVMQLLYADLEKYQPLVVGHFVELDFHIAGVEFYRSGMQHAMAGLPLYCTMVGSKHLVRNPQMQYLKLGQLYDLLFETQLNKQHNAMVDALATAESFFELQRTGAIDDEKIAKQQEDREKLQKPVLKGGCAVPVLLFLVLIGFIIYWL